MAALDVLIPTCDRPDALAVTLAGLLGQTSTDFRVVVSDQSEGQPAASSHAVLAASRALEQRGRPVAWHRHLPRRGMAEHRAFLLSQAEAPLVLFLDDDVLLEPEVVERLVLTLADERCGFVGQGLIGLSYRDDVRPHQQDLELWEGPVEPELVAPGTPQWERYRLHNAANLLHVQHRLGLSRADRVRYKVAWIGGCVLFDRAKLQAVGGFDFWPELPPEHCGEDVVAQVRVMARYGGCGVLPSGAYHQELPTTIVERRFDAPRLLPLGEHRPGPSGEDR